MSPRRGSPARRAPARAGRLVPQAAALERTTLSLVEGAGMREYFDPLTGEGLGSDDFSWTAAVVTDMLRA
jgi:hypothetical protein